jgi:putative ABC transport system substrate-binding protein
MRRRNFITFLGGAAAAWPLAARAQQPAMPVIGWLGATSSDGFYAKMAAAFRSGLGDAGFVDGRNVTIEYRWAAGQYDRLPVLASELIRNRVSVIVTSGGTASILAAMNATATIPIVFNSGSDPINVGAVGSLNRPSANLTGISNLTTEVQPKKLQLLHELLPDAKVVAFLVNPGNPASGLQVHELQDAAAKLGLHLDIINASTEQEIESALPSALQHGAAAVFVMSDGFLVSQIERIIAPGLRNKIPTFSTPEQVAAGALLGYGPDLAVAYRQSGVYVARILNGEKPADLPVFRSTKLELVINLSIAKTLGIKVPPSLLAIADEVIE